MHPSTDRTAAAVQFPSRAVCMPSDASSAAICRSDCPRARNSAIVGASFERPGRPGQSAADLRPASPYGPVSSADIRRALCAEVIPSMIAATSRVTNAARASRASWSRTCFVDAGLVACIARAGEPCLT
jgi:hypothetical protein